MGTELPLSLQKLWATSSSRTTTSVA